MKRFSISAALLILPLAAAAHDGMHGPGSEYDANEDGALSVDEYKSYLKESKQDESKAATRFAALDSNKDGELSSAEFARGLPKAAK